MSNPMHGSDDRWLKTGRAIEGLQVMCAAGWSGQVQLTGFRVRAPTEENAEYLLVVWGDDHEGAPVVGFHGSTDLLELFVGGLNRIRNGTMKWRPDEYKR